MAAKLTKAQREYGNILAPTLANDILVSGMSDQERADKIRQAGGESNAMIVRATRVGRIALYMRLRAGSNLDNVALLADAERILDAPNNTSKTKEDRRTDVEQAAYNAAKTWLSSFLSRNDIKSLGKNSGNKNAKGARTKSSKSAKKTDAPVNADDVSAFVSATMPPPATMAEFAAYLVANGEQMLRLYNNVASATRGKETKNEASAIVTDFLDAARALSGKVKGSLELLDAIREKQKKDTDAPIVQAPLDTDSQ